MRTLLAAFACTSLLLGSACQGNDSEASDDKRAPETPATTASDHLDLATACKQLKLALPDTEDELYDIAIGQDGGAFQTWIEQAYAEGDGEMRVAFNPLRKVTGEVMENAAKGGDYLQLSVGFSEQMQSLLAECGYGPSS